MLMVDVASPVWQYKKSFHAYHITHSNTSRQISDSVPLNDDTSFLNVNAQQHHRCATAAPASVVSFGLINNHKSADHTSLALMLCKFATMIITSTSTYIVVNKWIGRIYKLIVSWWDFLSLPRAVLKLQICMVLVSFVIQCMGKALSTRTWVFLRIKLFFDVFWPFRNWNNDAHYHFQSWRMCNDNKLTISLYMCIVTIKEYLFYTGVFKFVHWHNGCFTFINTQMDIDKTGKEKQKVTTRGFLVVTVYSILL